MRVQQRLEHAVVVVPSGGVRNGLCGALAGSSLVQNRADRRESGVEVDEVH